MTRPTTPPTWATTTNYNDPGEDWHNTPTRGSTPSSGERADGLRPNTGLPAQIVNFIAGNHGDWIDYLDSLRVLVRDDFTGDSLNRGIWKNIATGGSGSATFVDDAANGGNGVYKFDVSAAAANTISLQPNTNWNLGNGTGDFSVRFRARTTGVVANTTFFVGFVTTLGFEVLGSSSTALWRAYIAADGGIVTLDTPVSVSTSYKVFEIRRTSGVTYFYVDGTLVHETSTSINLSSVVFEAFAGGNTAGAFWIDLIDVTMS
jgi:hypothetical protein